jgi:hypothetical protein
MYLAPRGRTVGRSLDDLDRGLSDRTKTGMTFSSLVAGAQTEADRFRTGIFLCSSTCAAVEDTRAVYRFFNSDFPTELRRGDGICVRAIDVTADVGTSVDSMITGLETSFEARIHVETAGRRGATLDISGLGGADGAVDIDR